MPIRCYIMNGVIRAGWLIFGAVLVYAVLSCSTSVPAGLAGVPIWLEYSPRLVFAAIAVWPRYVAQTWAGLLKMLTCQRIFGLALSIRLAWLAFSVWMGHEQVSDFNGYDHMAVKIAFGGFLDDPLNWVASSWPVGSSLLFSAHYILLGHNPVYPLTTLAVLSALQVLMTYRLALIASNSREIALGASLVLCFWPEHVLYVNLLGSDVLFSFLVLAGIWVLAESLTRVGRGKLALLAAAGILIAASHWIRGVGIFFIAAAFLFITLRHTSLRSRIQEGASFVLGVSLLIAPMMILNNMAVGFPLPLPEREGGWSLYIGTNLETKGRWSLEDYERVDREVKDIMGNENRLIVKDRVARRMALERVTSDPMEIFIMAMREKLPRLWGESADTGWTVSGVSRLENRVNLMNWSSNLYHWFVILLACGAVFFCRRSEFTEWNPMVVYLMAGLALAVLHLGFSSQARYHHVFLPMFSIMASYRLASDSAASRVERAA